MDQNNGYGQEVTERESSSAEMVAIHQAMMEELGISRKDALPLEDKDENVPTAPLIVPIKTYLNLDDTEPGVEDLNDIAGGQLYRLRRGGSGLSSSGRGGHSASRGRGGTSNRGGHVSAGGRGNFAARGKDVDSSRFRMSRAEDHSIKVPPSAPRSAKSTLRAAASAVAPRATLPGANRPITSRFKLAPPSAFLSHNKIGNSPTETVAEPVSSVTPLDTGNGLSASAPSSST
ncbi:hypothetical protein DID88_000872 [Monilinia fructigena]|uniref:Uncharacterized protein n=1 Tax=Monilinia fructigena TaxID=38457 RepID=A0A395IZM3_9HELO|nr:hypothetical protein DID88_000872 [Monilinia fructigena]